MLVAEVVATGEAVAEGCGRMGAARRRGASRVGMECVVHSHEAQGSANAPMHQVVLVLSVDHLCLWLRMLDTEEEAGCITSARLVLIHRGLLRHDRRSLWWRGDKGKADMKLRECVKSRREALVGACAAAAACREDIGFVAVSSVAGVGAACRGVG